MYKKIFQLIVIGIIFMQIIWSLFPVEDDNKNKLQNHQLVEKSDRHSAYGVTRLTITDNNRTLAKASTIHYFIDSKEYHLFNVKLDREENVKNINLEQSTKTQQSNLKGSIKLVKYHEKNKISELSGGVQIIKEGENGYQLNAIKGIYNHKSQVFNTTDFISISFASNFTQANSATVNIEKQEFTLDSHIESIFQPE